MTGYTSLSASRTIASVTHVRRPKTRVPLTLSATASSFSFLLLGVDLCACVGSPPHWKEEEREREREREEAFYSYFFTNRSEKITGEIVVWPEGRALKAAFPSLNTARGHS